MTTAPLLTVPEVAKRLNVSRSYAYELVEHGEIAATRLGSHAVRVSEQALAAYITSCTVPAKPSRRLRTITAHTGT